MIQPTLIMKPLWKTIPLLCIWTSNWAIPLLCFLSTTRNADYEKNMNDWKSTRVSQKMIQRFPILNFYPMQVLKVHLISLLGTQIILPRPKICLLVL